MLTKRAALLFALIFAFSAFAGDQPAMSITPSSGPAGGGTEVTIRGDFASAFPLEVMFGDIPSRSTRKVDQHTLVAVTPAHLPGPSSIRIFEYDMFLGTPLTFTFTGPVPEEEFARILIPVHIEAVPGAFGSLFRTDLFAMAKRGTPGVYGLLEECVILCIGAPPQWDFATLLHDEQTYYTPQGKPGRFVYVRPAELNDVSMTLNAFDVSRNQSNYGTTLPIVRFDDAADTVVVFPAVPTDPPFRGTLRIYSDVAARVTITVQPDGGDPILQESVQLGPGANVLEPAFAIWTNFPVAGLAEVKVTAENDARIWALLTVTNNDTQHITALWPQP